MSEPVLTYIKRLNRPIFTSHEISAMSGKSSSVVTQSLNYLCRVGAVQKICRGVWCEKGARVSPYMVIPFLSVRHRCYVSFTSALHIYGIIEQIPQVISIASTGHTRTVSTTVGIFTLHSISPAFFKGFDWYKKDGAFLIAQPEKALIDCLYLSARKKKQFSFFPELHFPPSFSFKKAEKWAQSIKTACIRHSVQARLRSLGC